MLFVKVDIIEYSDDCFPGFVTCAFTDANGKPWIIHEKAPVVSSEDITHDTRLPIKGYIAGEIISTKDGIICFSTEKPWGIESKEGVNVFYLHENQISNI